MARFEQWLEDHVDLVKDTFANFRHLRKTRHTHNPVDDAMGNAEAMLHMRDAMGLRIKL